MKLFSKIPLLENDRILLRKLEFDDAASLKELTEDESVYSFLPTFLIERQQIDMRKVILEMYEQSFKEKESLIWGIFLKDGMRFCGLAELYGFKDPIHKISLGYRLQKRFWGQGIATETVALIVDYLYSQTDIEIITASTMIENHASANVLSKNGFMMVVSAVEEDWGYETMTIADKWIR